LVILGRLKLPAGVVGEQIVGVVGAEIERGAVVVAVDAEFARGHVADLVLLELPRLDLLQARGEFDLYDCVLSLKGQRQGNRPDGAPRCRFVGLIRGASTRGGTSQAYR